METVTQHCRKQMVLALAGAKLTQPWFFWADEFPEAVERLHHE
jgi:hypothetical protein